MRVADRAAQHAKNAVGEIDRALDLVEQIHSILENELPHHCPYRNPYHDAGRHTNTLTGGQVYQDDIRVLLHAIEEDAGVRECTRYVGQAVLSTQPQKLSTAPTCA